MCVNEPPTTHCDLCGAGLLHTTEHHNCPVLPISTKCKHCQVWLNLPEDWPHHCTDQQAAACTADHPPASPVPSTSMAKSAESEAEESTESEEPTEPDESADETPNADNEDKWSNTAEASDTETDAPLTPDSPLPADHRPQPQITLALNHPSADLIRHILYYITLANVTWYEPTTEPADEVTQYEQWD